MVYTYFDEMQGAVSGQALGDTSSCKALRGVSLASVDHTKVSRCRRVGKRLPPKKGKFKSKLVPGGDSWWCLVDTEKGDGSCTRERSCGFTDEALKERKKEGFECRQSAKIYGYTFHDGDAPEFAGYMTKAGCGKAREESLEADSSAIEVSACRTVGKSK